MTNNCGKKGAKPIATATMDINDGIKSVTSATDGYVISYEPKGFSLIISGGPTSPTSK